MASRAPFSHDGMYSGGMLVPTTYEEEEEEEEG